MAGYEIVPFRPELEPEIIALRNLAWRDETPATRRFLDWKYKENPYLDGPIMTVALHGGRVVGMRGVYGTCWEAGDARRVILPAVDDFSVAPEHRNTGVATLIMRAALDDLRARGFHYVVALSAGRLTTIASIASGWKSAGAMEPVARFDGRERAARWVNERLRGTRLLWRLARRDTGVVRSPEAPFRRLEAMGRIPGRESGSTIVFERAARAEAMAGLIERLGYDGRMRHVRDAEFLSWRYRRPLCEYGFVYLESGGELRGFLVLGRFLTYRPPMLPFHVVDMEGTASSVREELLATALHHGRFPAIGMWNAAVAIDDRPILSRAGFVPVELRSRERGLPCILVRAVDESPAAEWTLGSRRLLDRAGWDMRLLYTMHG